ncbi:CTP synthetase [Pseudodonghicola flavimaris]|uniref:CTP synthetase n=1 Tax=Pseudodonghicola flavimaris TaxID=3050036 RepID=A0ABT7EYW4_9RHOB|nr:CTP synthetase [Pseudodonghicola flavimaris]MDK3017535.1 CTP synthetase [Pseudodonghicola flavimaris]
MSILVLILHLFIGATLSGVALVVVLVAGIDGVWPLVGAVAGGFVLGFPAARIVARAMGGS